MSIRLEMLQVARLAPKLLGEATDLVESFLRRQQNEDGGFKDRDGRSDLYYTVFALDALAALQKELPSERTKDFLKTFGGGEDLDFVHFCCLAHCWAALNPAGPPFTLPPSRLEHFRARDGGYHPIPGSDSGTAYAAFLAVAAYQDLKRAMPDPLRLVQSLKLLETADGGWANERNIKFGATNSTAAVVTLLRNLQMPVNASVGAWLLARAHVQGGFVAVPNAPIPDLLSTATALHALAGLQHDFSAVKENCLDFIDTLWTNEGGFHGHWSDDHLDCEYTYYGLLALGHLSL